jgi:hypothetical protein
MFEILVAQNKAEVWSFLCQQSKIDLVEFFLKKQHLNQDLWETWSIANWVDLGNYVSSGQDGIFGFAEETQKLPVVVWDNPNLVLDEPSLNYLNQLNQVNSKTVYIVILKSDFNANFKKLILKSGINSQELNPIDSKIKQTLAKKYLSLNYPDLEGKMEFQVLNYLTSLDWPLAIMDMIDFLVLAQIESWTDYIIELSRPPANIFGFNLSKNPTNNEVKILYELAQNVDQNQLLYTMLYSKIEQKAFPRDWLRNLIKADFTSKTGSNQLLWAKWWIYDIIQK